jgi:hypothetical protein
MKNQATVLAVHIVLHNTLHAHSGSMFSADDRSSFQAAVVTWKTRGCTATHPLSTGVKTDAINLNLNQHKHLNKQTDRAVT